MSRRLGGLLLALASAGAVGIPGGISPLAAQESLRLLVQDRSSGDPVEGAVIQVEGRAVARTDGGGRATLPAVTLGMQWTVGRIGYVDWTGVPAAGVTTDLVVLLEPEAVEVAGIEVRTRALGAGGVLQPSTVLDAERLAERMAPSIAATIAFAPGVNARTNGPMASQPVIRGLGGDRVLMLEDGLRTGDIATTAPDHAVTIEPASARRIEVIRGPGGLLYGSNTLGGVVNVVREDIPMVRHEGVEWSMSSYAESVNRGVSGGARVAAATGPLVWQVDGSARTAGDTRTPGGIPLPFTDLDGFDVGAGVGLVGSTGHLGGAVREYRTFYGVPSSFSGVTLPGAHDGGVYIDAHRTSARVDGEWRPEGGPVEGVSFGGNMVRFIQEEFERGGFVGTRFGQLARSGDLVVRLAGGRHRGAVGLSGQWRDLRAEGSFTGTRPAVHQALSVFGVDEIDLGRATVLAGLRVDRITTNPLDRTETLLLRDIRPREFTALTGALGTRIALGRGWSAGVQVARAFRPPSIEELYSAGPHLANYAYEIGLPSLAPETGVGVDAQLRWEGPRGWVELAGYAMEVRNFIIPAPQVDSTTGSLLRDPRLRRYVVYRPGQEDARLAGVELHATLLPFPGWGLEVAADLPRGSTVEGTPLPGMPGGVVRGMVRRWMGDVSLGLDLEGRLRQNRVPSPPPEAEGSCRVVVVEGEATGLPAEFCPTPGALLLGATGAWRIPAGGTLRWPVTLTLTAENLLDSRWRDPLWRARLVAPQPGRNIRLAVQVSP